jgi:hypothetical protein
MDRLATPRECWEQVALCRTRADAATDEPLRAVWISMALIWTKHAAPDITEQRDILAALHFDHLVGAGEQRRWGVEAEGFPGFEVLQSIG